MKDYVVALYKGKEGKNVWVSAATPGEAKQLVLAENPGWHVMVVAKQL